MERLTARPWLLACGGAVLLAMVGLALRPKPKPAPVPAVAPVVQPEAVSALGYLEPAGEVVEMAAPISGMGGTPRLSQLLVQEGQRVRRGQLLASFDNRPRLQADLAAVTARLQSLQAQIRLQRSEVERYTRAAANGAAALVLSGRGLRPAPAPVDPVLVQQQALCANPSTIRANLTPRRAQLQQLRRDPAAAAGLLANPRRDPLGALLARSQRGDLQPCSALEQQLARLWRETGGKMPAALARPDERPPAGGRPAAPGSR